MADHMLQIAPLLDTDGLEAELLFAHEGQVFVQGLDTQVDRLGLEVLNELSLIEEQVIFVEDGVFLEVVLDGIQVRRDGVLRHIVLTKLFLEGIVHRLMIVIYTRTNVPLRRYYRQSPVSGDE